MGMFYSKSCCNCISLKTGAIILLIFEIVFIFIGVLLGISSNIGLINAALTLIFNGLGIYGIFINKKIYVFICVIYVIISVIFDIIFVIYSIFYIKEIDDIFSITSLLLFLLLSILNCFVIKIYHKRMNEDNRNTEYFVKV